MWCSRTSTARLPPSEPYDEIRDRHDDASAAEETRQRIGGPLLRLPLTREGTGGDGTHQDRDLGVALSAEWRGAVLPGGSAASSRAGVLCPVGWNSIEINGTFYSMKKPARASLPWSGADPRRLPVQASRPRGSSRTWKKLNDPARSRWRTSSRPGCWAWVPKLGRSCGSSRRRSGSSRSGWCRVLRAAAPHHGRRPWHSWRSRPRRMGSVEDRALLEGPGTRTAPSGTPWRCATRVVHHPGPGGPLGCCGSHDVALRRSRPRGQVPGAG